MIVIPKAHRLPNLPDTALVDLTRYLSTNQIKLFLLNADGAIIGTGSVEITGPVNLDEVVIPTTGQLTGLVEALAAAGAVRPTGMQYVDGDNVAAVCAVIGRYANALPETIDTPQGDNVEGIAA